MNTTIQTNRRLSRHPVCYLPHFAHRADWLAAPPDPPGAPHASSSSSS